MKTTKKGFTLIELIVVIAIIGVLAAILVPTMLGYVKKSKISSANSSAASIYKAINSALTELDEEGVDVGGVTKIEFVADASGGTGEWKVAAAGVSDTLGKDKSDKSFDKKVKNFFSDIDKMKSGVLAQLADGACVALASAGDSTYTGTYPSGVITGDNYDKYKAGENGAGLKAALEAATKQAGWTETKGE